VAGPSHTGDETDDRDPTAARLADVCSRRAAVYRALVLGFGEPSEPYLAAVVGGELVEGLRAAVSWLGPDAACYEPALTGLAQAGAQASALGTGALTAMAVEHARLFTGPGRPAVRCYASQYLADAAHGDGAGHGNGRDTDDGADDGIAAVVPDRGAGRLNGAAAAYAAAAYRAQGVTTAPDPHELPDHVTIELEFLFHLCRREEDAWGHDDGETARGLRRALDRFLDEHASRWLPEFAASVKEAARVELYQALADLLSTHLSAEFGTLHADDASPTS
jgi:TorA maturation chaperone TorD